MKKPHSVGYFSSYDRGLECLLELWPEIKKQVPDATLDIYYGWDSYDAVHRTNPEMMKWKWSMIRKFNELDDVKEHGRVSHQELAKAMQEIQVWAYPTEFTETHCITALKASEAKLHQVHTGVAALAETAKNGTIIECSDIYSNKQKQTEFIDAVAKALQNPQPSKQIDNPYWADCARVWSGACA